MELLWHSFDKVNTNDDDNVDKIDTDREVSLSVDIVIR